MRECQVTEFKRIVSIKYIEELYVLAQNYRIGNNCFTNFIEIWNKIKIGNRKNANTLSHG